MAVRILSWYVTKDEILGDPRGGSVLAHCSYKISFITPQLIEGIFKGNNNHHLQVNIRKHPG